MILVPSSSAAAGSGSHVIELVIASILGLLGIRSLVYWLRIDFPATTVSEHVLFSLHVMARVGTWFGLAVAFLGYAVVSEPQRFRWFVAVILVLAGVQLLTAASLGLGVTSRERRGGGPSEEPDGSG